MLLTGVRINDVKSCPKGCASKPPKTITDCSSPLLSLDYPVKFFVSHSLAIDYLFHYLLPPKFDCLSAGKREHMTVKEKYL